MKMLSDVDGDEVSLVRRAANRRRFLLLKGDTGVNQEMEDLLGVPYEAEGKMLDLIRKDGIADETTERAFIAGIRLLKGIEDEFSRETIEKLGAELYGRKNPPLNSSKEKSPGGLSGKGSSDGDQFGSDTSDGDLDGGASGDDLEGEGSAPKVAADSDGNDQEPDADADDQKKKKMKKLAKSLLGKARTPDTDMSPEQEDVSKDLSKEDDDERGTVEVQVPVKKEDGTWDLSGVPDESRPFFSAMIEKADKTESELAEARAQLAKSDDALLTRSMVEKAAAFSHVAPTDDLAPILKAVSLNLDEETFEKLANVLKAAEEKIEKGGLFTEMGRTGTGEGAKSDAYSQLVQKADELVEKNTDMTQEQAFDRALRDNPGLYDQYMADMGMGVR